MKIKNERTLANKGYMPSSKRKLTKKGEQTRDRILEVACYQILENGFHAATTREITNRLGMVPSTLYSHFKNKEKLFEAVLEKFHPWLKIPFAVENSKGSCIEEIVRNASDILLKSWDQQPEHIRLHLIELIEFRGKHLPDLFDDVFQQMAQSAEILVEKLENLETINAGILTRSLLGLFFAYLMTDRYTGMQHRSVIDGTAFDYFADIYLQGVSSEKPRNDE
jgi:AcrR family transcriptional regulator